ncbi:hypothetical protein NHX12_014987 [Muraenolepis orangiensis]|uniref:Beta/gamma crystallin 'Greek key' domain-containing protein n=1 Tax=Muraenolepis orangiensis TaxID=630683 RepID=A0A9Q0DD62_9TELE|nr:hypothetical protein NHX12_014987 [Muraenolepis orangiensis]
MFYEDRNFQGPSYETRHDLLPQQVLKVYDRSNFMGNQYLVKRGEYSDYQRMGLGDCIGSCRMIRMILQAGLQEYQDDRKN